MKSATFCPRPTGSMKVNLALPGGVLARARTTTDCIAAAAAAEVCGLLLKSRHLPWAKGMSAGSRKYKSSPGKRRVRSAAPNVKVPMRAANSGEGSGAQESQIGESQSAAAY